MISFVTCPARVPTFLFASPKIKVGQKKKATFFKLLRMKKGALRCCVVFSQFAYRRHDAEIIAAVRGYYAAVCVGTACFNCGFFCRVSGNN